MMNPACCEGCVCPCCAQCCSYCTFLELVMRLKNLSVCPDKAAEVAADVVMSMCECNFAAVTEATAKLKTHTDALKTAVQANHGV